MKDWVCQQLHHRAQRGHLAHVSVERERELLHHSSTLSLGVQYFRDSITSLNVPVSLITHLHQCIGAWVKCLNSITVSFPTMVIVIAFFCQTFLCQVVRVSRCSSNTHATALFWVLCSTEYQHLSMSRVCQELKFVAHEISRFFVFRLFKRLSVLQKENLSHEQTGVCYIILWHP